MSCTHIPDEYRGTHLCKACYEAKYDVTLELIETIHNNEPSHEKGNSYPS